MKHLTRKLDDFYSEIQKTERSLPPKAFLLFALTAIARVTAINRFGVTDSLVRGRSKIFANMYGMLIAPSGAGKDLLFGLFENAIKPFEDQGMESYEKWKKNTIRDLALEAVEKFSNKKDQQNYVKENSPHNIMFAVEDGTPEGLLSMRVSLMNAKMGGLFIHHSEFAQVFEVDKADTKLFMQMLKKGYEGDTPAKVTRQVESIPKALNVPMNMLVYTSPIETEDEKSVEKFVAFLNNGYARRMFFCMSPSIKTKPFTYDEAIENYERQSLLLEGFKYELEKVYKAGEGLDTHNFMYERDASIAIYNYQQKNIQDDEVKVSGSPNKKRAMHLEKTGRYWRAFKIAGLIAIYEHPEERIVKLEDVETAIYITELFAQDLENILTADDPSSYVLLYEELLKHEDGLKRVELYPLYKSFNIRSNDVKRFLDENLPLVEQYAPAQGYALVTTQLKSKGGGEMYKLEPLDKVTRKDLMKEFENNSL